MNYLKNNLSNSLCDIKQELLKYVYVDNTEEGKLYQKVLRLELSKCSNDYVIRFTFWFLDTYIMPFFNIDRTTFNRIRARFMRQVLVLLLDLKQEKLSTELFYSNLLIWINQVSDEMNFKSKEFCSTLSQDLIKLSDNIQIKSC